MRKLGIVLAIAVAVATVPLVALAWQGPDPAPGGSWGRHMGAHVVDVASFGWDRMDHWLNPAVDSDREEALTSAKSAQRSTAAQSPWQTEPLDPTTVPGDTQWPGCPMWTDLDQDGLPDSYPWPTNPADAVPPGYGPAGCPMWGYGYPDPTSSAPDTPVPGCQNRWGGHMWGRGMMRGGW